MVLSPLIVIIEVVSTLIRPITLAVRLTANIIAGHLLLRLAGGGVSGLLSAPVVLLGQTALAGLEVAVAGIQGYVFTILVRIYAKES